MESNDKTSHTTNKTIPKQSNQKSGSNETNDSQLVLIKNGVMYQENVYEELYNSNVNNENAVPDSAFILL